MDATPQAEARDRAYRSAGMAVFACQSMEITFVWCVKLVFRQSHVEQLADVESLARGTFRVPTKALLNELSEYVDVDPVFYDTLSDVVERRHELVHRWGLRNGLPTDADVEGNLKLWSFANELAQDAMAVTNTLFEYVCGWLARFPEMRKTLEVLSDHTRPFPERFPDLRIERA